MNRAVTITGGVGLLGGGIAALVGGLLAWRRSSEHTAEMKRAVESGGTFKAHLTGYWPFDAREDEKKMEGGLKDRKGKPLHTLEMHEKDPTAHPYVSVSGDPDIFPYGQRLSISAWPNAVFRVVDTGSHFHGSKKVYRVVGEEPLDICVDSSKTTVPKKDVTATIVHGDNFEHGKDVAVANIKNQTVAGTFLAGLDCLGALGDWTEIPGDERYDHR